MQRIVFGKLHLGQLDQSGLTSSDLKELCNSLVDTLKNSFHVRIEYPWQKEERAAQQAAARRGGDACTAAGADAAGARAGEHHAAPLRRGAARLGRFTAAHSAQPAAKLSFEEAGAGVLVARLGSAEAEADDLIGGEVEALAFVSDELRLR